VIALCVVRFALPSASSATTSRPSRSPSLPS
jgi:hypothetical protein